ncbi:MAG TPA: TIGR02391 family protein [Casimicrobiaceae bacterium]|nr:TIGR02391 family protein [Casimicrobiaceae bacterium]
MLPSSFAQAHLTRSAMAAAIPVLERRIKELRSADPDCIVDRNDAYADSLHHKYDSTLIDIFGPATVEYKRYRMWGFGIASAAPHISPYEIRDAYRQSFKKAATNLETIKSLFEEHIGTSGVEASRPQGSLTGLHPVIESAATRVFDDGHYANAVQDGCKALDDLAQAKSGRRDLTGKALMQTVFSPNKPVLRFNALESQSDKDEHEGFMHMFAGAMLGLRNPRAHTFKVDSQEQAAEYLGFLSMLARFVDAAIVA